MEGDTLPRRPWTVSLCAASFLVCCGLSVSGLLGCGGSQKAGWAPSATRSDGLPSEPAALLDLADTQMALKPMTPVSMGALGAPR